MKTSDYIETIGDLKIFKLGLSGIGYNSVTGESGPMQKLLNKSGSASVRGELVAASTVTSFSFIKQANTYDAFAVVAQSGIADGQLTWLWSVGAVCKVLFEDGKAAVVGNILLAAATDGRAEGIANPGAGLPGTDTHFKENGHILESVSSGTDILAMAWIHQN
jgi:hypothetical protein